MTVSRSQPSTDLPWEEYDKPDLVTRQIELMRKLDSARKALEEITSIKNEDFGSDWQEIEAARQIANTTLKDIAK